MSNSHSPTDEITEAARSYFASDFANPQRIGCPPRERLQTVARSIGLPSDELLSHLFTCSECFREFSDALRTSTAPVRNAARFGGPTFSTRLVFAFAAVIALVALSALIVISLRQRSITPAPTVAEREGESPGSHEQAEAGSKRTAQPALPATENDKPQASRFEESTANKNAAPQLASNYREIDLESYRLYRGPGDQGGSANKPILLTASMNQLRFRLPDGSPRGHYTVTVKTSQMDRSVANADVRSSDGKTLTATLDLRTLEATRYVLCISPEAHAPSCYEADVRWSSRSRRY